MGGFSPVPSGPSNSVDIWSQFGQGFNFGAGGTFNGFSQAAVPQGSSAQGQASGGFNTIPGMSSVPSSDSNNPFPANGIPSGSNFFGPPNSGSPNSFLSSGTIPGSASPHGLNAIGQPIISGKQLQKIYGTDIGQAIQAFLNSGAGFNQNVITAEQNAALPLEARGRANIMNSFANAGAGNSSSAAVGLGDFESMFQSQMENMFAQQYEQSVSNYLSVLMGTRGDAKEQNAQRGSWMNTLSGILSAGIGIAAAPFTGGISLASLGGAIPH